MKKIILGVGVTIIAILLLILLGSKIQQPKEEGQKFEYNGKKIIKQEYLGDEKFDEAKIIDVPCTDVGCGATFYYEEILPYKDGYIGFYAGGQEGLTFHFTYKKDGELYYKKGHNKVVGIMRGEKELLTRDFTENVKYRTTIQTFSEAYSENIMQLFQYMFSVIQGTEQQEYFTNKLKEFKKLIDEDNLTIYRIRDIPFNNDNPINIVCDQEDIKIGEYSISACNIGSAIAGTGIESYGNYYTYEEANQICPIGYHLPNKEELQGLYEFGVKNGIRKENNAIDFMNKLKLPLAGLYFNIDDKISFWDESGGYWSSTNEGYNSTAYSMSITPYAIENGTSEIHIHPYSGQGNHQSVRCFKD